MGAGISLKPQRCPFESIISPRQWLVAGKKRSYKGMPLGHHCRCMLEGGTLAHGWRRGRGTLGFAAFWRLAPNLSTKVPMVACWPFGW